jgi:tetratricopeptide (TPR) repeat protein
MWLLPLLYAAAVLLSAWVLSDARRRGLPLYAVAAWTLATLVSPHIVFPLYLITRIFTYRRDTTPSQTLEVSNSSAEVTKADDSTTHAQGSDDTGEQTSAAALAPEEIPAPRRWRTFALPLIYALALLSTGAIYFYRDYQSFDAHLARAANARLRNRRAAAIREYRAALRLSDDAHTHKLLAVQLAEDGQTEAALAEFRAAARGGDEDELLHLRTAHALDALGKPAEARLEYQKFLRENLCARPLPDTRCAEASARAQQ